MSNTSTTTQEPSYIDTVKNENGTSTNDINLDEYSTFFSCVKSVIISLLYSIFLAIILLYICKIAQANVLIDSMQYAPFGPNKKISENRTVDINLIKKYTGGILANYGLGFLFKHPEEFYSTKVEFDEMKQNLPILTWLKKMIDNNIPDIIDPEQYPKFDKNSYTCKGLKPSPTARQECIENTGFDFIWLYFYDVISCLLTSNFSIINTVFSFLNNYIPEGILLIFFTLFGSVIMSSFFMINFVIIMYALITNFKDLYSRRYTVSNTELKAKPMWEFTWDTVFWFTRNNMIAILFMMFGSVIIAGLLAILPLYVLILPLTIAGHIVSPKNDEQNPNQPEPTQPEGKKYSIFNFFSSIITYKKQILLLLFSYKLVGSVSATMGQSFVTPVIIALVLLLLFSNIFETYLVSNTELDSDNITKGFIPYKEATIKPISKDNNNENVNKNFVNITGISIYDEPPKTEQSEQSEPEPE